MAKLTLRQKIIIAAALSGKGGNVPGGSPDIEPTFTFITDESGQPLYTETGNNALVTENSQT